MNSFSALHFGNRMFEPEIRKVGDMKNVIYDKIWLKNIPDNEPLYYMYRGIYLTEEHKKIMEIYNIRYDITIILPTHLGIEFNKTKGHYHQLIEGQALSYPEIYQVLEGKATFLLQKEENGIMVDVIIIEASEGDIVIIPPNYGHVTINPTNEVLKMANWICPSFSSVYQMYERRMGGAYYKLIDGRLIKNKTYSRVPKPRFITPPNFKKILGVESDIYELIDRPWMLEFLTKPQNHKGLFKFAEK